MVKHTFGTTFADRSHSNASRETCIWSGQELNFDAQTSLWKLGSEILFRLLATFKSCLIYSSAACFLCLALSVRPSVCDSAYHSVPLIYRISWWGREVGYIFGCYPSLSHMLHTYRSISGPDVGNPAHIPTARLLAPVGREIPVHKRSFTCRFPWTCA